MIHITPHATAIYEAMVLYRNVLAEGTLAWSSQTADGFAANALGPQTYDFWTPSAVPATLSVTLAAAVECDCAAIVAHNLGSKGATVEVQHLVGASWVTSQSITPEDDRDLLLIFGEATAAQWRIRVTGAAASIGIAMIGPRFLIPGGVVPDYTPINLAVNVKLSPSITVRGQYVGTFTKHEGAGTSVQFAPQERWWIESEAPPFIDHFNAGRPFMWASCPGILEGDMAYCWRTGRTLSASYGAAAMYGSMSMEVEAYVGRP